MLDDKFTNNKGLSREEMLRLAHLSANNVDAIAGKLHSIEEELQYQRELLESLNNAKDRPVGDVKTYGQKIRAVRIEVTRLEEEFNKLYKEALEREKECDAIEEVAKYLGVHESYREEPRLAPKDDFVDDLYTALSSLSYDQVLPLISDVLGAEKLSERPHSFYVDADNHFNTAKDNGEYFTKAQLVEKLKASSNATDSLLRQLREIEGDLNRQKELLSYLDRADGVDEKNVMFYDEARKQVENNIKTLEDEAKSFSDKIKTIERQLDIYASVASWLGNNENFREEKRISSPNTDIDDEVTNLKMRIVLSDDEFATVSGINEADRIYEEDDYGKISLPEFFARIKEIAKTADVYAKKIHDIENEIARDKEILEYLNNAANITPENIEEYDRLQHEIPEKIKQLTWQLEQLRPRAIKAEFDADVYEKVARWLGDDTVYRKEKRIAEVGDIDEAVRALKKRIRQDGYLYKGSLEDYKKGYLDGYGDAKTSSSGSLVVKEEAKSESTLSSFSLPDEVKVVPEIVEKEVVVKKKSPLWIVLTFLFLALLGGSIGYYQGYVVKNYNTEVDSLNSDIDALNTNIDSLNSNIDSLNNTVDSLNKDVDTRDTRIDELGRDIEGLNSNIDDLTRKNTDLQTERDMLLGDLDKEGSANSELLKSIAEIREALAVNGDESVSLSELIRRAGELAAAEGKTSESSGEGSIIASSGSDTSSETEAEEENIWAIRNSIGLSFAPYGLTSYSNLTLNRNLLGTYGFGATLDYRMNFKYMFVGLEVNGSWFTGSIPFSSISAFLKFGGIIPLGNVFSIEPYIGAGVNFASSYGMAAGFGFMGGVDLAFKVHNNISLSLGAVVRGGYGYNSYNDKVLSVDFHVPKLTLNVLF